MYNIDQISLLIEYKEKKLHELQQNNAKPTEIQLIIEELKPLKVYKARYQIATILGLEKNKNYSSINYIGIEKEDISQYNLTSAQENEVNNLINEIPPESVDLFRARLEIAKLLKMEDDELQRLVNYEGIEENDPNNMSYRLTQTDIDTFNNLKTTIDTLKQNKDNKSINFNDTTIRTINEIYLDINTQDINEYRNKKGEYLDILFGLVDIAYKSKKFHGVNNIEFAIDIYQRFPDALIEIKKDDIKDLIIALNTNQIQDEEKYNTYLNLVAKNINRLSEDENNKTDIEDLLKIIDKTNYSLRIDLEKLISVDNIKIEQSETPALFHYLDNNYDSLNESKREKIYNYLKNRLDNESKDLTRIDLINSLLLNVKNNNFKERLRTDLSSNYRVEFNDRHVSSYSGLVADKIAKLEKKKQMYLKKKTGIDFIDTMYDTRIRDIDKEIEKLKTEDVKYNSSVLNGLDSYYNSKSEKIIELEKQIAELNELKNSLQTRSQQAKVERKIKRLEAKIKKLKQKQGKIEGIQKKVMAPKFWVSFKRGMIKRHFESKAETFEKYAQDYEKLAETNRNMSGMFSSIKAAFYEYKAGRYLSKGLFNRKIFDMLNNSNKITVNGSNQRVMNNNSVNNLRNQNNQAVAQQTI